ANGFQSLVSRSSGIRFLVDAHKPEFNRLRFFIIVIFWREKIDIANEVHLFCCLMRFKHLQALSIKRKIDLNFFGINVL
ncbi:MAG TPA: hypothetical protein PK937_16160, partial [bacterium]|nr:hypothetical protein [bacterium]